jgi:hypothetical protein
LISGLALYDEEGEGSGIFFEDLKASETVDQGNTSRMSREIGDGYQQVVLFSFFPIFSF